MTQNSCTDEHMRRRFKNGLAQEIEQWVQGGLVTETQAQEICQRYGLDYHQLHNRALGYNVLVALGYLFIGLALITLIGANWDEIPRALRMGGLVTLTAAMQFFGLQKFHNGQVEAAARVFFLGSLFYGASIILIAQIYHLGEHMADGVFWWALGALPFALITPTLLLGLQVLALALIWFFMELSSGFYPALFPLFVAGSIFVLLRGSGSVLLFMISVVAALVHLEYSLAFWWNVNGAPDFRVEHVLITVSVCVLGYSVGQHLQNPRLQNQASPVAHDYGTALSQWSLCFPLLLLFILSFESPWIELLVARYRDMTTMLIVVLLCWAGSFLLARGASHMRQVIVMAGVSAAFAIGISMPLGSEVALQVVDNLVLIAIGVALILSGVRSGTTRHFFLGISIILLTALFRYFSLIGDYIGGAILFTVFAAVMLGAARYWRHHQQLSVPAGESA